MSTIQIDQNNPVPNIGSDKGDLSQNIYQESSVLNEKLKDVNRAYQTDRSKDNQKNNTVKLEDIDLSIIKQLEKLQIKVVDDGKEISVPFFYSNPEKWKAIQIDGFLRDYNGKIILPAITFQRVNLEKDQSMMMFNRYLNYSVMRNYSEKNRYTRFNLLSKLKDKPVHEVYDVIMPDHMTITYRFIIWTEYISQMNTIIEKINFETDDYWGSLNGLKFRTKIDSFSHNTELQRDNDRMVKTEFDLIVAGYLLPDTINKFQGTKNTTQKRFTPKKVVLGMEVVTKNFKNENKSKLS